MVHALSQLLPFIVHRLLFRRKLANSHFFQNVLSNGLIIELNGLEETLEISRALVIHNAAHFADYVVVITSHLVTFASYLSPARFNGLYPMGFLIKLTDNRLGLFREKLF